MLTKKRATVEDLYNVPEHGKAELINGELVRMSPTGLRPGRASLTIAFSLRLHEEQIGGGYALADNTGFLVDLPDRESFSPDAAWFTGDGDSMRFAPNAPVFAVEIRSESDYGPAQDRAILRKVADYFLAGTQIVWDVDLISEDVIKAYHANNPDAVVIYRRGEEANAEPIIPGWRFEVDKLFA